MLVDNAVEGDSRVQKQAQAMADAGWDVTLVGSGTPSTRKTDWMLGRATVRVVKVARPLGTHRSKLRWSVRRPLAYSSAGMAQNRSQSVRARRIDLRLKFAALAARRRSGASATAIRLGQVRLLPARVAVKIFGRWVETRTAQMDRLKAVREDATSLLNRAQIRFWHTARGVRCWRRLDPSLWDFEIGLGPTVDRLEPDIIHANDHKMLGVAARAKARAAVRGRAVKVVWDAHEYVPGLAPVPGWPSWLPAQIAYEEEYRGCADAVVTVSPGLAELLRDRHHLAELPAVVMNCPDVAESGRGGDDAVLDVRADCAVGSAPLLVYCGGISQVRGVSLIVEALPDLPGVHVAFVSLHPAGRHAGLADVQKLANDLGVAERFHPLPYVKHWQVPQYIASADAAVSPLHHLPNHEIALSNKFFEYSHARLPLVVSDVRTMAAMVRETGQGEVFRAGNRDDYVRAVRAVLADPQRYRDAYRAPGLLERWTWDAQAAVLDQVYSRLTAAPAVPSQPGEPVVSARD
jgi:glycogen(starch) synthase